MCWDLIVTLRLSRVMDLLRWSRLSAVASVVGRISRRGCVAKMRSVFRPVRIDLHVNSHGSGTALRSCDSLHFGDGLHIRYLTLGLRVLIAKLRPTLRA